MHRKTLNNKRKNNYTSYVANGEYISSTCIKKIKKFLGDAWTIWPIHAAHAMPAAQGFRRSAECSLHYNTTLFSNETLLVCFQTLVCGLSEEHSSKSPSELANWNQCVSISYTALHTVKQALRLPKSLLKCWFELWTGAEVRDRDEREKEERILHNLRINLTEKYNQCLKHSKTVLEVDLYVKLKCMFYINYMINY